MYTFVNIDIIKSFLNYYDIVYDNLSSDSQAIVVLLSNLLYIFVLFLFIYIIIRLFSIIRNWFDL